MLELVLHIGRYLIRIIGIWVLCSTNCEYRNYKWGHKFIKGFDAHTPFQLVFTILQSERNTYFIGAITYIGYWCSIISTIAMVGATIVSVYNADLWYVFETAFIWCVILNVAGCLIQLLDSFINRIL